jgi:hypothetical protein
MVYHLEFGCNIQYKNFSDKSNFLQWPRYISAEMLDEKFLK